MLGRKPVAILMPSHTSARIWCYVVTTADLAWAIHSVWVNREGRTPFFLIGASIFFFLYLLPLTVFQARLEPKPDGLHVLQYRSVLMPYADVRRCIGFFLFPFPMVMVITNRKFPLRVLLSGDTFDKSRLTLIQDGRLAKSIKAMKVESTDPKSRIRPDYFW
jgi:hypothetical protein